MKTWENADIVELNIKATTYTSNTSDTQKCGHFGGDINESGPTTTFPFYPPFGGYGHK